MLPLPLPVPGPFPPGPDGFSVEGEATEGIVLAMLKKGSSAVVGTGGTPEIDFCLSISDQNTSSGVASLSISSYHELSSGFSFVRLFASRFVCVCGFCGFCVVVRLLLLVWYAGVKAKASTGENDSTCNSAGVAFII